jgi:hypothetical protein
LFSGGFFWWLSAVEISRDFASIGNNKVSHQNCFVRFALGWSRSKIVSQVAAIFESSWFTCILRGQTFASYLKSENLWTGVPLAMNEFVVEYAPILITVTTMLGLWLILRNHATSLASTTEFDRIVSAGKPVYLRFFKNT